MEKRKGQGEDTQKYSLAWHLSHTVAATLRRGFRTEFLLWPETTDSCYTVLHGCLIRDWRFQDLGRSETNQVGLMSSFKTVH